MKKKGLKVLSALGLMLALGTSVTSCGESNPGTKTTTKETTTSKETPSSTTDTRVLLKPEFLSKSFTFDGLEKSLEVTGLPSDVSVSYTNNGKINAG